MIFGFLPQGQLRSRLQKWLSHDADELITLLLLEPKMPVTRIDSIDREKPEWLAQMETVLEVLNEGVIISADGYRILFANSRFMEMTGMSRQDLAEFDPARFFSTQERDFLKQQIDVAFRDGHNRYAFALPRKRGGRLPVIISSRNFQNSGSRYGIVTFTDISEQVRAEEDLRSANAKLQKRQMEIEEDLRLAARVQNSLAPRSLVWDSVSVDAFYHPVHSIGGDFALVNSNDHESLSLLVCDVSGHGIGSALVANRIYSETSAHMRSCMPFVEMFGELNRFLIEDIAGSGMFVTLAAARIDSQRRRMVFAGAGHPPAMLARRGQNPVLLESRSMILGALPDAADVTSTLEVQLQPDDRIVLYTDGITEVFNSKGQMLGVEGVQEIVRRTASLPAEEMKQAILDEVAAWREGPPTDDVSLMLVHVR
jgi:PAS domain S-box-containing protein